MKKVLYLLLWLLSLACVSVAQQGGAPTVVGCANGNSITGNYFVSFVVGQPIQSTLTPLNYKARLGFPYDVSYLKNTFIGKFNCSKGYFPDYISLQWNIGSNAKNITKFVVSRRVYQPEGSNEYQVVASLDPSTRNWQDIYAEASVLYEYKIYAAGIYSLGDSLLLNYNTGIGFRSPVGTATGRITYSGGTAVKGVIVQAETTPQPASYALEFNGVSSGVVISKENGSSLTSGSGFTFQAWVQDLNTDSKRSSYIFDKNGVTALWIYHDTLNFKYKGYGLVTLPVAGFKGNYYHVSAIRETNSLILTLTNYKTFLAKKQIFTTTSYPESESDFYIGRSSDNANKMGLLGYIDEIRIWGKALDSTDIRRDYNRIINGNEKGLSVYYQLNEDVGQTAYDLANTGTKFNGNDAILTDVKWTNATPTTLGYKGVTDQDGNFIISRIPYTAAGSSYTFTPMLGVHKFNPNQALRFFSAGNNVSNNVDFIDNSSFTFKGKVCYNNSTFPVEGVNVMIDDNYAYKGRNLVASDDSGQFTVDVPIGRHKITLVKQGHVFSQGVFPDKSYSDTTFDFQENIVERIKFYDATTALLTGRVVGGAQQSSKALGFGLSKANLGYGEITLKTVKSGISLRSTKTKKGLDSSYVDSSVVVINKNTKNTSKYIVKDNVIIIYPDTLTGEYAIPLPPEQFVITSAIAGDLKNPSAQYVFDNSALGTLSLDINTKDSSLYKAKDRTDTLKYRFNKRYDFVWQAEPSIEVTQNNKSMFGTPSLVYNKGVESKDTVKLYDADYKTYTFGYPVFAQGQPYTFKVDVFEEYLNQIKKIVERVPVTNGQVSITNEFSSITSEVADSLNSNGFVNYNFIGGTPNIQGDYTKAISIQCSYPHGTENKSIVWKKPFRAIVLGGKSTNENFITAGPIDLITILRDPPGSNSYAYLEKGTTIVKKEETSKAFLYNMETNLSLLCGVEVETSVGLGFMVTTNFETTNTITLGVKHSSKVVSGNSVENTYTTTQRWQTSGDPAYVGAMADVFIGNSTNIVFGATDNLTIVRDTTVKNAVKYMIGKETGYRMSPSFSTSFLYTQNHIVNYLIPNLQKLRANLFASQPTIYKSHKAESDPNFCHNTKITRVNDALIGDAYDVVDYYKKKTFVDTLKVDSIDVYTKWISNWVTVLAQNEREKVTAIKNQTLDKNRSFDAGSKYEGSASNEVLTATTSSYSGETYLTGGGQFGFQLMKAGFQFEFKNEIGGGTDNSSSNESSNSITYGYVLDDQNGGDYLSVDVFNDNTGHGAIFRTRGGQTSCPYEDATEAQYYEPASHHSLGAATMRIEVPEISVANAYQTDVPSTQAAVYDIALRNNSEAGITVRYELAVVDGSNPNGAIIKVDGAILGNGRNYAIPAGGELKKKLTIEKGVADVMKYEQIGIVLRSMCQADPTDDWVDISDTIFVSAEFVPSCTPLTLATPLDKWTVNTETGTTLNTRITDFNKNDGNFVGILLEYKESSSSEWKTLSAFYPDSATFKANNSTGKVFTGSDIQYAWDTKSYEDRNWDLRATAVCKDKIYAYSAVASGIKDTKRPQVFGTPQPTDGILSAGEDVMIRFSEPLESGLVGKGNIMVQGVLNGAAIDHSASLQLDGKASYAKADGFSFTGQPITIEFWMQRDAASKAGTIFAKGINHERFEIASIDDKTMIVSMDTSSFKFDLSSIFTTDKPATAWHHFAVVYDNATKFVVAYGDDKLLLDKKTVNYLPTERGSIYVGCSATSSNFVQANVQDVRIWNTARNLGDVYANMYTQLSGNEANLLAYWTLDEGKGTLITDRANAHSLTLHAGWNIAPRGNAITFNGKDQALIIDGKSVVIDATRDATLEFWFKAAKPTARACLLYNGLNDVVIDGKAPNSFGVFAETDGTLSLLTRGTTTSATSLTVCDNQWHHFAVVLDRLSNIRTYIDGALQAQLDNALLANLAMPNLSIGAKRQVITSTISNTDMYFAGSIDEVRVWQTARRASLINRYMNSKLIGNEQALVLYYPFEAYIDMMGMKTLSTSLKDKTKADSIAGASKMGEPVFTVETPAVKDARPLQTLDASVVVNNDQLLIELPADMAARYEKRTLEITAYNVQDKNGNKLASPAQWIAYVEKNTVVWDKTSVDVATTSSQTTSFTALVVNKGGAAKTFSIGNLPAWLTASSQSGTVQPNSSTTITFTVNSGVNFGAYQHKITLSSDYGYDEVLEVNLTVKATAPAWTVNPSNYQYTMNVFGTLKIVGVVSTDENDMVGAFVNGECRGVCSLKYLTNFDITEAMLSVYSNKESGEAVTFLIWDASEGKTYSNVTPTYTFAADKVYGSPKSPIIISCDNSLRTNYDLNKGWNWISVNVQNPQSNSVQNLLANVGSNADVIKSQQSVFDQYSAKAGWSGSLTAAGGLKPEAMYKLSLTKAGTAQINGTPVDPTKTAISIAAGWNWIGFVPQYNMTTEEALASYGATEGDIIKSQKTFSMFYDRIGWIGSLNYLEPGKGYMLQASKASSLLYPERSTLKSGIENQFANPAIVAYNATNFQTNMTLVAALADSSQNTSGKVLAAYNGANCVGVAQAIQAGNSTRYFVVAGGNDAAQTLRFALVDTATGMQTAFVNSLAYSNDAVQGTVSSPYLLYSEADLAQSTNSVSVVEVTPSPFVNELTVKGFQSKESKITVRLINTLGQDVLTLHIAAGSGAFSLNLNELASSEFAKLSAGCYAVEVSTADGLFSSKVIKN